MYESFFQLRRRPFESGVDIEAYYPSETHQSAVLRLRYAVEHGSGVALLAGVPGTGKTMIARLLLDQLAENHAPRVHIVFPQMPASELLAYLACELSPDEAPPESLDQSVRRIERALARNAAQGRRAVVVIDEAHLIEQPRTFEALRLLLNFESGGRSLLALLLIGQPPLVTQIERLRPIDERVAVKCLLRPLTVEETKAYVEHRLSLAGAPRPIFTVAALEAVHRHSQGLPRRINRLCDLALLVAYSDELSSIDPRQIEAVAQELVGVASE